MAGQIGLHDFNPTPPIWGCGVVSLRKRAQRQHEQLDEPKLGPPVTHADVVLVLLNSMVPTSIAPGKWMLLSTCSPVVVLAYRGVGLHDHSAYRV